MKRSSSAAVMWGQQRPKWTQKIFLMPSVSSRKKSASGPAPPVRRVPNAIDSALFSSSSSSEAREPRHILTTTEEQEGEGGGVEPLGWRLNSVADKEITALALASSSLWTHDASELLRQASDVQSAADLPTLLQGLQQWAESTPPPPSNDDDCIAIGQSVLVAILRVCKKYQYRDDDVHTVLHICRDRCPSLLNHRRILWLVYDLSTAPQAHEWFLYQQSLSSQQQQPSRYVYTKVIQLWAQSQHPDALNRIQSLLDDLWQHYQKSQYDPFYKPTEALYASYLKVVAERQGPDVALTVLQQLDVHARNHQFWPSTVLYNVVLNAYAEAGNATMAEQLLVSMMNANSDKPYLQADIISFTTVLKAWSRHDASIETAERSEQLLRLLMQVSSTTNDHVELKPNALLFATVMNTWSRVVNHPESPIRCQTLLDDCIQFGCQPSVQQYQIVLRAWYEQRKVRMDAPDMVERVVQQMIQQGIRPDTSALYHRLHVWYHHRHRPDAVPHVMQALDELPDGQRPGLAHWKWAMLVCATAGPEPTHALWEMSIQRWGIQPHPALAHILLSAYLQDLGSNSDRVVVSQKVESILQQLTPVPLSDAESEMRPTPTTTTTGSSSLDIALINMALNIYKQCRDGKRAHRLWDHLVRLGVEPNATTYSILLQMLPPAQTNAIWNQFAASNIEPNQYLRRMLQRHGDPPSKHRSR